MDDLPVPPGFIPESDYVDIWGYKSTGSRIYHAREEHAELIAFFNSQIPKAGWQLMGVEESPIQSGCSGYCFLKTDLYFSFDDRFFLEIELLTQTDTTSVRIKDYSVIDITISEYD